MAVVAQGYSGVLLALVDVVSEAGRRGVADTAGQALDPCQMLAISGIQFVVHVDRMTIKNLMDRICKC